ncbi:hypothetical protein [Umezawaea sp. Da 62-37]|uniref:hypothetical protein n=1 Tax=Umezawaea sp. Da 62-37 TaxID=3075927 RepID=UPI0028F745DC|nr:hypothetical protein [Umezawaea sp. Da 62-37]WNV90357.1 hypothetical protein RM788_19375 [Umezawaea sp. Da 62-37]
MAKLSEEEKARRALKRRRKAALEAEEDAVRRDNKQREWDVNGTRLTWDEYVAGASCRGCGLAISDGRGSWPVLLKMDAGQRREYDADDEDFRRRHVDCRSHQWSVQGSRTQHCGFCCPSPPLSRERIEEIAAFLAAFKTGTRPDDLDTWRLTLTCDHIVEKTQHHSNDHWSIAVVGCPECEQTRGVVVSEKLPPDTARREAEKRRVTDELAKARIEYERLQKKADAARRRALSLEDQLTGLN